MIHIGPTGPSASDDAEGPVGPMRIMTVPFCILQANRLALVVRSAGTD